MESTENDSTEKAGESSQTTDKKSRRRNVTFSDTPVEAGPEVSSKSKMTNGVLSESNNQSPSKSGLPTRQPPDGEENVNDMDDNALNGEDGNNKETPENNASSSASQEQEDQPDAANSPPDGDGDGSRRASIDSSATTCSNNNNNWRDEMDMDVDEGEFEEEEEAGEGEEGDYYDDYEYDPYSHEWVPKIKPPDSDEDSEEALLIPKQKREVSLSPIAQALLESATKNKEAYIQEQEMVKGDRELSFFDELLLCLGGCRKLCHIHDMPQHLQFNKFIHSGYRHTQDTWGCVLSLMYLHNETLNILTHLIPIIYVVMYWRTMFPWDEIEGNLFLNILGCSHIVASIAPWIGSVFYHMMMSHNSGPQFYQFLLQVDMFGIWLTECFGALTNLSAATWCLPEDVKNYIVAAYGMAAVFGLQKALTAWTPVARRMCFAPVFISRILGIALRLSSWGGGEPSVLIHVFLQDIISVGGGIIGVIRIPEKWFPGKLDLCLNSHHIMHIMVVIAVVHMNLATNGDIRWIINNYNGSSCPVN